MRGKSHTLLGTYLLKHYMPDIPNRHKRAFLLGCIEPDRNPVTYLKGSLRFQWLRGHNYLNAQRFMQRIANRLEQKDSFSLFDYYTLGKLIHYTADAFTFAHNDSFPESLEYHREYEALLQNHFVKYLHSDPRVDIRTFHSIMAGIRSCHREYRLEEGSIHRDSRFALQACCCVLAVLLMPKLI